MFDYDQLATLATIHRRGSLELAAADLHLTPSAVSQRLKALEERIGTRLIHRAQPCRATETGLRLIAHHDQVVLLEAALLPGTAAPTALRLALNADSLATWVIPALAACNGFLYDLVIDDQDFSQDWLAQGQVAAAITGHPGPLQGCDTIPLGRMRYRATASPGYMKLHFAEGVTRDSLSRAPALTFNDKDSLQSRWATTRIAEPLPLPVHRLASPHGFIAAVLAGIGWGMNPEQLAAPHLASGALVELVPDTPLDVPLYWQFARLTAPALAPVTAAVLAAARGALLA